MKTLKSQFKSKSQLTDIIDALKFKEHDYGFLYDCEYILKNIIEESNYQLMNAEQLKSFHELNKKIFDKVNSHQNSINKNNIELGHIKNKDLKTLTKNESAILNLMERGALDERDLYFELQDRLKIARMSYPDQVKDKMGENVSADPTRFFDQQKARARKKNANQKYFLGGSLLSLSDFLDPAHSKHPTDLLIDMSKVYVMHELFFKRTHDLLQMFEQYQHVSVVADFAAQLAYIEKDPRDTSR